jgi:5-methylthioadenosine/S-adenosylhomocysteine deaminase
MQSVDSLLEARWVIPIVPSNTVYENYSIVIDQGKIIALLPTSEAKNQYHSANTLTFTDHVLLPGLVNAHTHSPMVLFRGLADDLTLMDWLEHHIWPAEKAFVNAEFIRDGMQLAMAEMLCSGTTCFNEHYFFPEVAAEAITAAGLRARVGLIMMSAPTPHTTGAQQCLSIAQHLLEQGPPTDRVGYSVAPHAPYTTDDAILLKVKVLSQNFNVPIHMHVHETAQEISQSLQEYGKRPLQRLHDLGLLSPRLQTVHMTQVTAEDIALLQAYGCQVVHCPESNLKLASGYCPVQALWAAGITVALGTDGAASNNDLDLFGEMRTAALLGKAVANDPTATSAHAVLEMATLGGAKALGLAHEIGSLERGKAADIIAVNLNHLNTQPVYHPISQLVYAAHSHQVTDVWVAGQPLLRQQQLLTLDRAECLDRARVWRSRVLSN